MSVTDLEWYKSNSPSWKNPDLKGLDVDGSRYHSKEFMDKETSKSCYSVSMEGQLYDFGSCCLCWGNENDE